MSCAHKEAEQNFASWLAKGLFGFFAYWANAHTEMKRSGKNVESLR